MIFVIFCCNEEKETLFAVKVTFVYTTDTLALKRTASIHLAEIKFRVNQTFHVVKLCGLTKTHYFLASINT